MALAPWLDDVVIAAARGDFTRKLVEGLQGVL